MILAAAWLALFAAAAKAASTPGQFVIYRVRPGDTITSVAKLFGVEPVVIIVHNSLKEPYHLKTGERLKIPNPLLAKKNHSPPRSSSTAGKSSVRPAPPKSTGVARSSPPSSPPAAGATYTVRRGDTLAEISRCVGVSVDTLAALNGLKNPSMIYPGQILKLKGTSSATRSSSPSTAEKPSKGGGEAKDKISQPRQAGGTARFDWPVNGRVIKEFSPSGYMKCRGIVIAAAEDTPVRAARSGVVTFSDASIPGYGTMIIIDHGDALYSIYAHNKKNLVKVDQRVRQGDRIALVGKRPQDPEPNLYFEIRNGKGQALDPRKYLSD
ncbi:MAG: hypothetical protein Kow0059_14690 [Candidatus Sumerlaeia bacterium]